MQTAKTYETFAGDQDLRWRPARLEDVERLHALQVAVDEYDHVEQAMSLAMWQLELEDSWLGERAANTRLLFAPDGELAGYALVLVDPEPLKQRRAYLDVEVHPSQRGRGLRAALLDWAEGRARERLAGLEADLPGVIRIGCDDRLHDRMALYRRQGYRITRHFYRMRRALDTTLPERELPPGLTLRTYTPELDAPLHAAFNESFLDHWNFEPVNAQDWRKWFTGREGFRPDLTYLAMDGDEIAGFSINGVDEQANGRLGIQEGWVRDLGTRRPWRRRGVAGALLAASMRAFKADGLAYATLGVDTQNPTGALSLYKGLGFAAVRRFVSFSKEV